MQCIRERFVTAVGLRYHKSMRMRVAISGLLFTLSSAAHAVILHEDIGELKIHDLLLRPNFLLQEPQKAAFSIGESSFALRWELEKRYAGVIRVGPRTLLNPLARYSATVDEDIVFIEAFAEYNDEAYGRFRFGRLPVEFGVEGRKWERDLIFPRSLLFQKRAMMLRDVGAAYDISYNHFYTGIVAHNGESDRDMDGRTWYTARWGYKGEFFDVGVEGQTGSTKPAATSLSTDTLAGVDPTKEAKWRLGGINAAMTISRLEWTIEAYFGEREQEQEIVKFSTGHSDLSYEFSKTFSSHLRYDFFDPNQRTYGDLERQVSLALVLSNKTRSSNLILVGTKGVEQGASVANDELRLIWSLSPSSIVRF